jgi:DNA-binding XRE family transcriptional regulator
VTADRHHSLDAAVDAYVAEWEELHGRSFVLDDPILLAEIAAIFELARITQPGVASRDPRPCSKSRRPHQLAEAFAPWRDLPLHAQVRSMRAARGMTQRAIERATSGQLTDGAINHIEQGRHQPSLKSLELLSRTLNCRFVVSPDGTYISFDKLESNQAFEARQ